MSDDKTREIEREIVIVRRGNHGEYDGHHGGVWKIAYADFMTAMMAFFLVMWLVNAANEETKASVASYFNPIELMDEKPADRSIQDQGESSEGETNRPAADTQGEGTTDEANKEVGREQNATAGEETEYSESDYFENPYAVLAEIALETGQQANVSDAGEGGAQNSGPSTGASGGQAYRDPFDPDFWSQQAQREETVDPIPTDQAMLAPAVLNEAEVAAEEAAETAAPPPAELEIETEAEVAPAEEAPAAETELAAATPEAAEAEEAAAPEEAPVELAALPEEAEVQPDESEEHAAELEDEIREALAGINGRLGEGLDVQPAEGGLLISLTDQMNYAMFNIGSAVPKRDMVLAMEKIGALLVEQDGNVVIRGHTDARPFRGEGNDNWRLSTDRAHSAYYMLVRGGLAEDRIVQVSGFADRRLKLPEEPYADANRRIEILLQPAGGG